MKIHNFQINLTPPTSTTNNIHLLFCVLSFVQQTPKHHGVNLQFYYLTSMPLTMQGVCEWLCSVVCKTVGSINKLYLAFETFIIDPN